MRSIHIKRESPLVLVVELPGWQHLVLLLLGFHTTGVWLKTLLLGTQKGVAAMLVWDLVYGASDVCVAWR